MINTAVIYAKFTPTQYNKPEEGEQPDPENAEEVTIIAFSDIGHRAIFIDSKGQLRSGYLRQFSGCNLLPVGG